MHVRSLLAFSFLLLMVGAVVSAADSKKPEASESDRGGNRTGGDSSAVDEFLKKNDKNSHDAISKDELDADQQAGFGQIDRNGDGRLDRRELRAHSRRMQQGGRPVEAAVVWVIEAERDTPSLAELQDAYAMLRKLDSNHDDRITKEEVSSAREQLIEQHCQAAVKNADSDHNGNISRKEAKNTVFERRFDKLDADGDGSLTQSELQSAMNRDHAGDAQKSTSSAEAGKSTSRK